MLCYEHNAECPYFPGQDAVYLQSNFNSLEKSISQTKAYDLLLKSGFRRSFNEVYIMNCPGCNQCTPIRIPVERFIPSKSQRRVGRLNSDLEVIINQNKDSFVTDEKIQLFREYDFYHNKERMTFDDAKRMLKYSNDGYEGVWNMEYRLNGRLIGVAILDLSESSEGRLNGLSSNYFYYDTSAEILKRSLGVYSVLKEIEVCQKLNIPYYYLGLYLPDCKKMNYKINYKPYELYYYQKWFEMPESPESVLNPNYIIEFPKPGSLDLQYPEICCATYDISLQHLYSAYMQGIFPWFDEESGDPVLWHNPEKRFVIFPEEFHVPKSLEKFLKKNPYTITEDTCFEEVMKNCAKMKRVGQNGTWIGPKMIAVYKKFHELGYAHSIEVWHEGNLVGGFYGVLIGSVFFGESMFTKESNSSKTAFVLFARRFFECGGRLIDCQVYTDNMARYNAREIPRVEFLELENKYLKQPLKTDVWERLNKK